MKFVLATLGIALVLTVVLIIIRDRRRYGGNIFERGSSVSRGFNKCCARIKNLFGGGA